jgi:hypothetical protein
MTTGSNLCGAAIWICPVTVKKPAHGHHEQ